MLIEIDIDNLKRERESVQDKLRQLDSLIQLAESYGKPRGAAQPSESVQVIEDAPLPTTNNVHPPPHAPARGFTAGLRRAVIMGLYTGPSTEQELSKALGWDQSRTRTVVSSMLKFRICFLSEHGRLTLSDEGIKQAKWYMVNPGKLTYCPNGKRKNGA